MHPAQMEALGRGTVSADEVQVGDEYTPRLKSEADKAAGGRIVWSYDAGYNKGGLKGCWNCHFTCDFTADLEAHWQKRHGSRGEPDLRPSPVSTIDRVVGRDRQQVEERIKSLLHAREIMVSYLCLKAAEEDWHGLQDSGSDLRDIDSELVGLRWVLEE
jgi:hypothetical protein